MYTSDPARDPNQLERRRRGTRWTALHGVLEIGDQAIPCTVLTEPTWEMHGVAEVAVSIDVDTAPLHIRYSSPARLDVQFDDRIENVFAGPVKTVEWDSRSGTVTLVSPLVELREARIGGAAFWSTTPGEVGPLIGELLGRPEVGLDLGGLDGRSDVDLVFVSCPVDGLEPEATFLVGQVVLSHETRIAELAQTPSADPLLLQRFQDATCWATAVVAGPMDWATTSKALRLIDCGLAWLMVVHSTGLSTLRDHTGLPYSRQWVRSRPRRRGVTLRCGDRSGGRHLSGGVFSDPGPPLDERSARRLPGLPSTLAEEPLIEAVFAWRRSLETGDRFEACSALCDAVECIVSGVEVERLFGRAELDRLRGVIPDDLSSAQRTRVSEMLGSLNAPPLMVKIREFLIATGIATDEEDLDAFAAVRKARNDFVHGRGNAEIEWTRVNRARGWVARLVAEAILSKPDSTAPALGRIRVREG